MGYLACNQFIADYTGGIMGPMRFTMYCSNI